MPSSSSVSAPYSLVPDCHVCNDDVLDDIVNDPAFSSTTGIFCGNWASLNCGVTFSGADGDRCSSAFVSFFSCPAGALAEISYSASTIRLRTRTARSETSWAFSPVVDTGGRTRLNVKNSPFWNTRGPALTTDFHPALLKHSVMIHSPIIFCDNGNNGDTRLNSKMEAAFL